MRFIQKHGDDEMYQEQNGDYRVKKAEPSDSTDLSYHFWQYQNGDWKDLDTVPEEVMVERLRVYHLHSADDYEYWRLWYLR